jgi:hypothetical protein
MQRRAGEGERQQVEQRHQQQTQQLMQRHLQEQQRFEQTLPRQSRYVSTASSLGNVLTLDPERQSARQRWKGP